MRHARLWFFLMLACWSMASGHPGGTDDDGCHFDPETKEYHCH